MPLQLHISGPGLDVLRVLSEGDPEQVLGRDADCGICLPDPQRNVSRRHLAVWNEGDFLHFRVLSVVNGVTMPFGEAPPGAKGVLPPGQSFMLAEYSIDIRPLSAPAAPGPVQDDAAADPWSVFDRDPPDSASIPAPVPQDDDPFGDWGFETTFAPGAGGGLDAGKLGVAPDLGAFLHGLGLDPDSIGPLSTGELEAIGRMVRTAVLGMLELHTVATGVKQDLNAEDRTMVASQDNNPLKSDWPEGTKLHYMFGGRAAGVGFINPERALQGLLAELMAHEAAVGVAARAAVDGAVREFSPDALKSKLLGGGTRLFEGARAWDAYSKYYAQQGEAFPAWVQRLLDKYFADAYLRESMRLQRQSALRARRTDGGSGG